MAVKHRNCRAAKREQYNKVQEDRRVSIQLKLYNWKKEQGCKCCKENDPCCLDLHHLDPSEKEGNPSSFTKFSWNKLMKEASKCIVVCRNCHAKIHAGIIKL